MSAIIQWMKEYVGLFLAFTIVLYMIPSREYRGYLRFFLELVLVLFCLRPMVELSQSDIKRNWDKTYLSFYEEMKKREKEAEEMLYLDMDYINVLLSHQEAEE